MYPLLNLLLQRNQAKEEKTIELRHARMKKKVLLRYWNLLHRRPQGEKVTRVMSGTRAWEGRGGRWRQREERRKEGMEKEGGWKGVDKNDKERRGRGKRCGWRMRIGKKLWEENEESEGEIGWKSEVRKKRFMPWGNLCSLTCNSHTTDNHLVQWVGKKANSTCVHSSPFHSQMVIRVSQQQQQ